MSDIIKRIVGVRFVKRIICPHYAWIKSPVGVPYKYEHLTVYDPYKCKECGKIEYHDQSSLPISGIKNPLD